MVVVATASALPSMARPTAFSIYSYAALPHIAETFPYANFSGSIFRRSITSITPDVYSPSEGSSISCSFWSVPQILTASASIPLSPVTTQRAVSMIFSSARAFTVISGPIPAGSPIGITMTGLSSVIMHHFLFSEVIMTWNLLKLHWTNNPFIC